MDERGSPPPGERADLDEVIAPAAALAVVDAPVEVDAPVVLPPLPPRRFPGIELAAVVVAVVTAAAVAHSIGDVPHRATPSTTRVPRAVSPAPAAPAAPGPPPAAPAPAAVPAVVAAVAAGPPRAAPSRPVLAARRPAPKPAPRPACAGDPRDCPAFQQAMREAEFWRDAWRHEMP